MAEGVAGRGLKVRVRLEESHRRGPRLVDDQVCSESAEDAVKAEPAPPPRAPTPPLALRLALAYAIERAIEDGTVANLAEASRRLGVSRARVTQVMGLLHLPARIQDGILDGTLAISQRSLRAALETPEWE